MKKLSSSISNFYHTSLIISLLDANIFSRASDSQVLSVYFLSSYWQNIFSIYHFNLFFKFCNIRLHVSHWNVVKLTIYNNFQPFKKPIDRNMELWTGPMICTWRNIYINRDVFTARHLTQSIIAESTIELTHPLLPELQVTLQIYNGHLWSVLSSYR